MSAYFGTDQTQRLQRKSDDLMPWIMATPGACVTGRIIAADNWRALERDLILQHLDEDGMFAFRWITPEDVTMLRAEMARIGACFFDWNGFMGDAATLRSRSEMRLAQPLAKGFDQTRAAPDDLPRMQAFLAEHGITPLSTDLMGGRLCPALSIVIKDAAGTIAAAGFTGMLQNRFSLLADCAWMGLIAVDPAARGMGFGSRIAAALCKASLDDLGAARVIAFAAPDNAASIAMLTGAGLTPRPEKSCVAAISQDRPTR